MRFEWNDSLSYIGHYELTLYDDDNEKLDDMWVRDYTNPWMIEHDTANRIRRKYAYEAGYCNGSSMHKGFGLWDGYENEFGYHGKTERSLKDIKRWCEQYLADLYINAYKRALERLDEQKRRHDWFVEHGYS